MPTWTIPPEDEPNNNETCCEMCGESLHVNHACTDHRDRTVCQCCFDGSSFVCSVCDHVHSRDDIYYMSGYRYCPDCYDERFTRCDECGHRVNRDDVCSGPDDEDRVLCRDCAHNASAVIHEHDFKPRPQFFRALNESDDVKLYFGVEVEVERSSGGGWTQDETAQKLNNLGYVYCKRDGSRVSFCPKHAFLTRWLNDLTAAAMTIAFEALTRLNASVMRLNGNSVLLRETHTRLQFATLAGQLQNAIPVHPVNGSHVARFNGSLCTECKVKRYKL